MKVLLISGHGGNPFDSGACGNGYREADLTIEAVRAIGGNLNNKYKVECDLYPTTRDAYKDMQSKASDHIPFDVLIDVTKYDYVLEVHFNALNGNAKGTEVFSVDKREDTHIEDLLMKKLSNYFTSRGSKKASYYVMRKIEEKGVHASLLEICFIDNQYDMMLYTKYKNSILSDIADAIAEGLNLQSKSAISYIPGQRVKVLRGYSSMTAKGCDEYDYTNLDLSADILCDVTDSNVRTDCIHPVCIMFDDHNVRFTNREFIK